MSGFFKNDGTNLPRQKRERKSTAKVIAMKELASAGKIIRKKKNENSSSGKHKLPYYVRYHERKDGILVKTFRCAKCAGFVRADRKECGRCIARIEYERLKSLGVYSSVEMRKIVQQLSRKKKVKLDTAAKNVKSKIHKKAPKDGVKTKKVGLKPKKVVGFKTNMLKKVTSKPFKSSLQTEMKSIHKKSSIGSSPKRVVGKAKSQNPKIPKLNFGKQKNPAEGLKLEMPKEIRPKSSKATKTQSSFPDMPVLVKEVHCKSFAYSSQILLKKKTGPGADIEEKSNTPKSGMKDDNRKSTKLKLKTQSKRLDNSQFDVEQKPSTSDSGMKKCKTENLGIKLKKRYAIYVSNIGKNKSTKPEQNLQATGTTHAHLNDPITSLKATEIPTVIIDSHKAINKNIETTMRMYEKEQNIESNPIPNLDIMTPRNTDKENLPSRDLFFGYLNLEQNTSHDEEEFLSLPTNSTEEDVDISEILLDSNMIGEECFSGLLNSPNIEIIEEKDKN